MAYKQHGKALLQKNKKQKILTKREELAKLLA